MRNVVLASSAIFLALTACSKQGEEKSESAEDYAARIGGASAASGTAAASGSAGQLAQSTAQAGVPVEVPVPPEPDQGECRVEKIEPFYGQPDSPEIRKAILAAVAPKTNVRFVVPGPKSVMPDPTSSRLNVMIDITGIIRTARCG